MLRNRLYGKCQIVGHLEKGTMRSRIGLCLLVLTLVLTGCTSPGEDTPEPAATADPHRVLTEKIRLDWTRAMATIRAEDRDGFMACMMSPQLLTTDLFDAFRTVADYLPAPNSCLALVFYTYPPSEPEPRASSCRPPPTIQSPEHIRDAFVVAGPFQVEGTSEVVYSSGDYSEMFAVRADEPHYLCVHLTNEPDDAGEPILATYRFSSPIIPLRLQECAGQIADRFSLWQRECHMEPFSEHGVRIRDAVLSTWSGN